MSQPPTTETFAPSNFPTHQEELEFLSKLGFATNPYNQKASSLEQIWQIQARLYDQRSHLPYQIDGLVIKLNNNQISGATGVVGKTPRAWCAVKFSAEEATTKLLGVTWQVGRTGRVTPVAELEAVQLAGTTVKRSTLHNYKEFLDKNLHPEDTLIVHKAGDIIPEVIQVLENLRINGAKPFTSPSHCPECQHDLEQSPTGIDLLCPNTESCKAQVVGRLSYYTGRNLGNITGLSEKNLERFMNEFGVLDIPDLFNLPYEKIRELEGFGEKSAENLEKSVENAKQLPDYKFLAGLGIDGIGPEVAKLICQNLDKLD
jgi:DNA ligase (NAD+)